MFDFHMHSNVSFDGKAEPMKMIQAALDAGLKEICFTDHRDYDPQDLCDKYCFAIEDYRKAYQVPPVEGITVYHGLEFGMLPDNTEELASLLREYPFDFVIGSSHFAQGLDPYFEAYWQGKTLEQGELAFMESTLECVRAHDDFDVLGHLTWIGKTRANPVKRPVPYHLYKEVTDEILRILVDKGKGIEVNTSGIIGCGDYLPSRDYLLRFKELGGEIVTVGSDAHNTDRVGELCREACRMVQDIFGYVCTFAGRKPAFHKL